MRDREKSQTSIDSSEPELHNEFLAVPPAVIKRHLKGQNDAGRLVF